VQSKDEKAKDEKAEDEEVADEDLEAAAEETADHQLDRAIEVLKSWTYFEHLRNKDEPTPSLQARALETTP
jgi:hypothetical protein